MQFINIGHARVEMINKLHTTTTESRAATAKMSAQETTGRPQTLSTSNLIWSITSNPLIEFLLGPAFFSLSKADVESKRIDASQPYIIYSKSQPITIYKTCN
jgi:hypothetical protein